MVLSNKREQSNKISFLFALLLLGQAAALFASAPVPIRGTVLDEQGRPVAGATVRHYDLANPAVCSDENGRFTLPLNEVEGWSVLWAFSPDGRQLGKSRINPEEGNPIIPEVEIKLSAAGRQITGRVLDFEGRPVQDAIVGGDGWGGFPSIVRTDAEGRFTFPWDKDEPLLQIFAIKAGTGFNFLGTEEVREDRGPTPPEKIKDGPFEIRLAKPHRVEVRVTDLDDQPLPGCMVFASSLYHKDDDDDHPEDDDNSLFENERRFDTYFFGQEFRATTDEQGIARFDWIPEDGFSRLEFYSRGPDSGVRTAEGNTTFYGRGEKYYSFKTKESPVIRLPKQAKVEGTVVYSDGSPASWVQISIRYENGHGLQYADVNGVFTLTDNFGTWGNIGIESERETLPGLFRYDFGDGSDVKRQVFTLRKGVRVHGIVFDEEKNPCTKHFIIFFSEHSPDPDRPDDQVTRQTSNARNPLLSGGMYQCILPPGIYDVFVLCGDLRGEQQRIEIKENEEEAWLDLQLQPRSDE